MFDTKPIRSFPKDMNIEPKPLAVGQQSRRRHGAGSQLGLKELDRPLQKRVRAAGLDGDQQVVAGQVTGPFPRQAQRLRFVIALDPVEQ